MENQGVQATESNTTPENVGQTDTATVETAASKVEEPTTNQQENPPATPPKPDPEIARLKAALDKATHEAAEAKRSLRAKQTAEEQKAEEEREKQEAIENELKELRKQASVSNNAKRIISFVGDENVATTIAEALYGAEDIDAAIDELNRAWIAKEKRLKLEYGKIPAPGVGEDAPKISKDDFRNMSYSERLDFKSKYPEAYRSLSK